MRKFGFLLTALGLVAIVIGLAVFAFTYVGVIYGLIFDVALVSEATFSFTVIAVPTIIGIGAVLLLLGVVISFSSRKSSDGGA
jgi:uncharacterized membrane protein